MKMTEQAAIHMVFRCYMISNIHNPVGPLCIRSEKVLDYILNLSMANREAHLKLNPRQLDFHMRNYFSAD